MNSTRPIAQAARTRNSTAQAPWVTKCDDPAGVGGDETVTTVDDPANNVGLYTSIAIGADGLCPCPLITTAPPARTRWPSAVIRSAIDGAPRSKTGGNNMRLVCAIMACLWLSIGPAVADHVDLVTGRVLYLPFDGTLADDSGNMHTVIETGSVGFSPGILGAAADFDGTQTVVFPSIADTYLADSGFTIAFWFRIDLAPVQQRYSLLGQRDVCNFDDFIDIRPSGAEINLAMGQPSQVYRVDAPYALGEWHHYAAVHDGLDLRLYLNGELIDLASSDTTTFSIANPLGIAVSPCIGVDGTEPYIGLLDELLVYDLALDSEQVRAVAVGHIFADGFEASN